MLENPPTFLSYTYTCIIRRNNSSYTIHSREKIYIFSIDFKIYSPEEKEERRTSYLFPPLQAKGVPRTSLIQFPRERLTVTREKRGGEGWSRTVGLVALAGQNRSVTEDTGPTRGVCIDNEGAGGTAAAGTMSALGDIHDWLFQVQDRSIAALETDRKIPIERIRS